MIAPRFFAILDPHASGMGIELRERVARARELRPVFDHGPILVLATPDTPMIGIGNRGLVIGEIFRARSSARVHKLGKDAMDACGQMLVDQYWGDYVALAPGPDDKTALALRAPSGGVHAFRVRHGPITCIASHVEMICDLELASSTAIDWDFIAHHLAFSHLHVAATGIAGVDEILPGTCAIEGSGDSECRTLWSPWSFAAPVRRIATFGEAKTRVREAVLQSTMALVAPGDHVALELSGGLDSSIVAAALAATGRSAIAINLATPGPEGDERHYARAVSESAQIPLIEAPIEGEIDLTKVTPRLEARPGMLAMLKLADSYFAEQGRKHGITAFINGTGGDCVFCSLGTSAPAADRLQALGPRPGVLTTVRDLARVHDSNIWSVGRRTWRQARRLPPTPIWRRNHLFLQEESLPAEPDFHPWLVEPDAALGGSRAHIHAILASYSHLDGYGRHTVAPSIFPLLSQPVVEACLTVPTWLWVAGGRDRSVAREAFRDALPRAIVERRTKGGMDAFCARTFERNRERLRAFLLDGRLADAGLLDRDAIESYLARPFANRDQLFYHLLPIIDAETWMRGITSASA